MSDKLNSYSIDNGRYQRFLNKSGKATGIKKIAIDIGRNDSCLCGSGKKFKRCCDAKGMFFVRKNKSKFKQKRLWLTTLKIRLKRIFN